MGHGGRRAAGRTASAVAFDSAALGALVLLVAVAVAAATGHAGPWAGKPGPSQSPSAPPAAAPGAPGDVEEGVDDPDGPSAVRPDRVSGTAAFGQMEQGALAAAAALRGDGDHESRCAAAAEAAAGALPVAVDLKVSPVPGDRAWGEQAVAALEALAAEAERCAQGLPQSERESAAVRIEQESREAGQAWRGYAFAGDQFG